MSSVTSNNRRDEKINELIESIFFITINKNGNLKIFMEEIAPLSDRGLLNLDLLEQALFERLLLPNPVDYLLPNNRIDDTTSIITESQVIIYLYNSFKECQKVRNVDDFVVSETCDKIEELILRNASTSMNQPDLYEGQSLSNQWLKILQDTNEENFIKQKFLVATAKAMKSDDELTSMGSLKAIFYPMFNEVYKSLRNANMITLEKWIIPLLMYFVNDKEVPQLGELLIDYTTPNPDTHGRQFSETIFGQLLSLSILPKNLGTPFEFFDNPAFLNSSLNDSLWNYLSNHQKNIFGIFKALLVMGPSVKNKTMEWFGSCLHANIPRGQINNSQDFTVASDAFMINFCSILLRLCGPLCRPGFKVSLVDPTYCAVKEEDCSGKLVHLRKASKETCLQPTEDNEIRSTAESYNFITELFFMTHKAIELSYAICMEKFAKFAEEIRNLQTAYQNAVDQGQTDVVENVNEMLKPRMQRIFSYKKCLTEPENEELILKFFEATAVWLIEINGKSEEDLKIMEETKCFAPKSINSNKPLPLPKYIPHYLKSIPEHVLNNIINYLKIISKIDKHNIKMNEDIQNALFKMLLIFVGNYDRSRNPHLRGSLVEILLLFIEDDKESNRYTNSLNTLHLFDTHPDRLEIVPNLLNVYITIEATGESVDFEMRFVYRVPMYTVIEFLWKRDEQKECFRSLALEAERNIEAVDPPLFLRFINLLINDAIYLLDDSLSNLQEIRQLQVARDNGEWDSLSASDRQQNTAHLAHLCMKTKFYNATGRSTIHTLQLITSEIKAIFCHASMVDRIVSMLNYFLFNLVGPKNSTFKVKNKEELLFDPADTVLEICRIYVNFKESDEFCLAVSQDGRSYSAELFKFAEEVLVRIGGGQLIFDINEFAIKVQRLEKQHKEDQEALTDPPDDYLDPIMSTLMLDPVILPSSNVTVDRPTIARHLLSDQSDPFNRSPLTMDRVKPNLELKEEINKWIEQKRREYSDKAQ